MFTDQLTEYQQLDTQTHNTNEGICRGSMNPLKPGRHRVREHHILVSETWSTPIETRMLWHVNTWSWFLIILQTIRNLVPSDQEQGYKCACKRSHDTDSSRIGRPRLILESGRLSAIPDAIWYAVWGGVVFLMSQLICTVSAEKCPGMED